MLVSPVAPMMMFVNLLLICFLSLFTAFFKDFDVVVEYSGDDGDHVGFDNSGSYVFGSSNANVHDALKCQVPLPHPHHVLAPPLFEYAYEALDATVDCKNIANTCGRGRQVGKVVERVDQG